MVKKNTEYKGIQKKLVAAIAMVLVASIMVVTSSYAWFTLSTAPEVTGISTSVGSNGNLEIALLTDGLANIKNTETNTPFPLANTYWGNLVDLSSEQYHLDDITLMPAALTEMFVNEGSVSYVTVTVEGDTNKYYANADGERLNFGTTEAPVYLHTESELTPAQQEILEEDGVVDTRIDPTYVWKSVASPIRVPVYGADGRINDFNSNSVTGIYDSTNNGFVASTVQTGVRAIGIESNLSAAELMMRNARKDVSNARGTALNGAINSLTNDAVKIADIAIKHQLDQAFTKADVNNLRNAEENLREIVDALEDAIYKSVIALGVSQSLTLTKEQITITSTSITAPELDWVSTETGNEFNYSAYEAMLVEAMQSVISMRADLDAANTAITALEQTEESALTYEALRNAATSIMDPNAVEIEGKLLSDYSMGELVSVVSSNMSTGVDVGIPSGIYAEIAKFVGNYTATALMSVDADEFVDGMGTVTAKANMQTAATEPDNGWYLNSAYAWLTGLKAGTVTSTTELMSDLYAYAIDLAFRTNAANSNLLLQTEAANRVADSEVTQGGGSYMEFTAGHPDFTIEQMANLMSNIRVVFYDPDGTILAVAALDVKSEKVPVIDEATKEQKYWEVTVTKADGATTATVTVNKNATMTKTVFEAAFTDVGEAVPTGTALEQYLAYEQATDASGAKLYEDALGNLTTTETNKPVYDVPHYTVVDATTKTIRASLELYSFTVTTAGAVKTVDKLDNQVITALTQNEAKAVSAMVYLDGNEVENADVAIGGSSMTGKLNLQFASSATLTPMDYDFGERLAKPEVSISGNTLTINKVDKATNYDVFVYGQKVGTVDAGSGDTTTYEIPTSVAGVPAGTYEVTVVATASGYVNSNASDPVNVTLVAGTGTDAGTQESTTPSTPDDNSGT